MRDKLEMIDIWYYRLSLADGDLVGDDIEGKKESCSISSQRKCIAEFAKRNLDDTCKTIEYIDDGYTGTNFSRPGFQKLLFEVMKGRVRTLIVKDLSRLGRDYLEVGYYLERVFPLYRVRVILVNDDYDSAKIGEVTAGIDIATKNLINEWYSKDISTKIKSVVDIKKYGGEYVFGAVPYGYKKGKEKNSIVVDPEPAKIVRRIFHMACQGVTYSQIAQTLNSEQVMTPSKYLAEAGLRKNYKIREFWTYESIRNIIENRIYTGDTEAFKSHVKRVGSKQVKLLPLEERPVIENTHEAIVSRQEFFDARNVVKSNKKSKPVSLKEPLTGYLVCGCCGNKMYNGKKQNKYYYCASARYNPGTACENAKISKAKVKDIVYRAIQVQIEITDLHIKQREKLMNAERTKMKKKESHLKQMENQLEMSKERGMDLYEEYIGGKISREEFQIKKQRLSGEQEALIQTIRQIKSEMEAAAVSHEEKDQEEEIKRFQSSEDLSPEMMKTFVKRVVVKSGQSIHIEWNFKMDDSIASQLYQVDAETG